MQLTLLWKTNTNNTNVVGICVIAYSLVGRGWLTGNFKKIDDLSPDDYRPQMFDRFKPEVFD